MAVPLKFSSDINNVQFVYYRLILHVAWGAIFNSEPQATGGEIKEDAGRQGCCCFLQFLTLRTINRASDAAHARKLELRPEIGAASISPFRDALICIIPESLDQLRVKNADNSTDRERINLRHCGDTWTKVMKGNTKQTWQPKDLIQP